MRLALPMFLALVAASPPSAAEAGPQARTLWIRNVGTGAELRLCPFRDHGQINIGAWRRLNRLFGRGGGRVRRTIHPRLVRTLAHVQTHFGGARINLRSAYRTKDRYQWDSYHQVGRAIDLTIEGVANRVLMDYCLALQSEGERLGCGYYPHSKHVHIDVRGRSAVWVQLSRRGPPRYAEAPRAWLREH